MHPFHFPFLSPFLFFPHSWHGLTIVCWKGFLLVVTFRNFSGPFTLGEEVGAEADGESPDPIVLAHA